MSASGAKFLTCGCTYVLVSFMASAAVRRERQDAVLAELSELGLTLARDLHARALAAETAQDADRLALAFQRVSRGVRQTFALELKLDRARRMADREGAQEAVSTEKAAQPSILDYRHPPAGQRKERVRGASPRLIWNEAEGDPDE